MFHGVIYSIPGGISLLLWLHCHGHHKMSLFFHLKLNTTLSFQFQRRPCLSVFALSLCTLPSFSVDSTACEGLSVCRGESLVLTFPIQLIHRYCFLTRNSHPQEKERRKSHYSNCFQRQRRDVKGKAVRQVLPYEFEWPCSFSIIQVRLGTIYMQDSAARWRWRWRWTFAGFADCFVGSLTFDLHSSRAAGRMKK